ncbi:glycosyltransferase [Pontibacter cellulosilyticus]|uniref:Glycosyltransferase n=1 Tax=Pontibacter cellulosilyticus TaxID=1720253 RepID=A0A923N8X3_9BACT|nr:glycosyltransferase [Pontibacter cellulosilyticus]MBC5995070.1 glycosyltransferase [Pontibacter cellulosilyticus]
MNTLRPEVNVVMLAYNQEKFISKAIESVLAQRTKFKFNLIIGEDCSTDNTHVICEKYAYQFPDVIHLMDNSSNLGLIRNYKRCFEKCEGDFIAILEGDDYWIDPLKLQIQYDEFKKEENIGLVHTSYKILKDSSTKYEKVSHKVVKRSIECQGENLYSEIIKKNFVCAVTTMFRRNVVEEIDFDYFISQGCKTIDYILWLHISLKFNIKYIERETAVYRVLNESISNNKDLNKIREFAETKVQIAHYYLCRYPIEAFTIDDYNSYIKFYLILKSIKCVEIKALLKHLYKIKFNEIYKGYMIWKQYF